MKTRQCILIALAVVLLPGCRPGRMVTEKRVKETDSTAVWVLKDSLQLSIDKLTRENRELKEQTTPPRSFNLRLLLAGIITGFFIGILLVRGLMLRRKY